MDNSMGQTAYQQPTGNGPSISAPALGKVSVLDHLVAGIDFGVIPGCERPSLLKPGAEKLCQLYNLSQQAEIVDRVEDWRRGVFAYSVKTVLLCKSTGVLQAEGLGSCNTRERRYRGKDPYTMANTVLKIAKKRSLIDATLAATQSSGLLTQDLEDITDGLKRQSPSKEELQELFELCRQSEVSPAAAKDILLDRYGVETSLRLTTGQLQDLISYLGSLRTGTV